MITYGKPITIGGIPVVLDGMLFDGDIAIARDGSGGRIVVVGTRPLTWTERTIRAAARRNLADVYRWLGWPIPNPNPMPGREFADRVRLATEDISTERR